MFTRPNDLCGTYPYWPREQLSHYKFLTPPSDVFSIAAVFYECLTGMRIRDGFGSPDWRAEVAIIARNPVVSIRERSPHIPADVAGVIDRALAEMPVDYNAPQQEMRATLGSLRYPDAGALRVALADAMRRDGLG